MEFLVLKSIDLTIFIFLAHFPFNYRLKNNKRGIWNKDVLGGFFS